MVASLCWLAACTSARAADDDQRHFFETSIRPILAEHCVQCHGEPEQSGGLRLDSVKAVLTGGDGGPVIDLDRPQTSRLLAAIRRDGDIKMPPDGPLSPVQVAAMSRWVEQGAWWPDNDPMIRDARLAAADDHWAFQPIVNPAVPQPQTDEWTRIPIDAFVLARLEASELTPSPAANRRTLIRRVSYALTGLPPTPEEVDAFVNDSNPAAYEAVIDRLLDSPHYGEHWARHWLDVARYSDTKGYVYAREERFWLHAWVYRDWVVRALNEDMPYDRFLMLQMAADQVEDARRDDLAAMGFLTLGRRFLGVERDIIDDRIDVVCRGTLGLTVGCARCHDHKYDPIPTADYYSLYGIFDSAREEVVRLSDQTVNDEFEAELAKRRTALDEALVAARAESSNRVRSRIADYLTAQTELDKYPPKGFDQIFSADDLLPAFVHRWERYLREAELQADPVFVPWHCFAVLSDETFAEQSTQVTERLHAEADTVNPLVAEVFATPPASFAEVIERYAALFVDINAQWSNLLESAAAGDDALLAFNDPAKEQLRRVLYGPDAPCEVPHESIVHIESHVDTGTCGKLWGLQKAVDRWLIESEPAIPHAVTLVDREKPALARVFVRGNPARTSEVVSRHFLSVLSDSGRQPFENGSGRRELADAIIDPTNPLTARVIVNRVWTHHFGAGLVTTPSDFGTRSTMPSHPELLDWLAHRFVESGWSLKDLHRLILMSATFRQNSVGSADADLVKRAQRLDPENRLLWRMNSKRLSFEELRDSLLSVGGHLDRQAGGRPKDLFSSPYPTRRTLYGLVDRQFFPNTLRMFDFANPDLHIPQRPETTVPQQALFFMNHPLVVERVRALAAVSSREGSESASVSALFRRAFQREPTNEQLSAALQFLASTSTEEIDLPSPNVVDWQYGYGSYNDTDETIAELTPLPHFTGQAWQGGSQWPDSKLGWLQLTATGGHPGNDRTHAAIRRWTAPRSMTVEIESTLAHDAAPGDGIRAFIVSSRAGQLHAASIHQQTDEFTTGSFDVEAGETIDFIVDIGEVLNSDQYLWNVTITETSESQSRRIWNSESDFEGDVTPQLTPFEQLTQVLLESNEFLFID